MNKQQKSQALVRQCIALMENIHMELPNSNDEDIKEFNLWCKMLHKQVGRGYKIFMFNKELREDEEESETLSSHSSDGEEDYDSQDGEYVCSEDKDSTEEEPKPE